MNGTVKPNGAFTSYWFEYGSTSALGSKTTTQSIGSGYPSIQAPAYVTGLAANTTYYYRLVAQNSYGKVAGVEYTFKTTQGVPPPRGSAPSPVTLSASGISRTTANISGTVNPDGSATQYWFEYGKTQDLGSTIGFISAGDGTAKVPVSASISNLDAATTYYFRVNAQNQFGTITGAIVSFKTSGPAATQPPVSVTKNATSVTASAATLHGTVDPNGLSTNYWFEYSTDSLLGSVLLKTTASKAVGSGNGAVSLSADVSGLASNTTYFFRIVGESSAGTVRGENLTFTTK